METVYFYRERGIDPGFWAEPINALTNLAFLIAAIAGYRLAHRLQKVTDESLLLVGLAGTIAVGSFLFHTLALGLTMWLDILPIAAFQIAALWLFGHVLLQWSSWRTALLIVLVVGSSFAALPLRPWLNGSLFYVPPWLAIWGFGIAFALKPGMREPYLLLIGAVLFTVALVARTIDRTIAFELGTHFIWHLLNGLLVYLMIRVWILNSRAAPLSRWILNRRPVNDRG